MLVGLGVQQHDRRAGFITSTRGLIEQSKKVTTRRRAGGRTDERARRVTSASGMSPGAPTGKGLL
ncbi:MAG: hypothetical protein U0325_17150 [Polyangiales bacterium]